jgi:hypothetical protein
MDPTPPDGVIRISKEELGDSHVDDMLKRQMSMRGDPRVTRSRSQWLYQNWVLLAVAGMIGALAAWGALEPFFSDHLYLQGKITSMDQEEGLPSHIRLENHVNLQGSIVVKGEKIYLLSNARVINPDRSVRRLEPGMLHEGEEIGAYVNYHESELGSVSLGVFIVPSPPPQNAKRAALTLHQLSGREFAASLLLFPAVAGLIGLFIGATDGIVCRLPRRALLCGAVGLVVGLIGGFVSSLAADVIYAPFTTLAQKFSDMQSGMGPAGFILQVMGRALAWCVAGCAMGLGQGIALRSKRLLLYGFLGGLVGGLLGGLLFDPIYFIFIGPDKPSALWSRLIGFAVIGLCVGGMIGVVELLARDAWLRMTQGPLTGKEFLIFKDVMNIGSSPRSDIYLFNDPLVAEHHAVLRAIGDECEIEARQTNQPLLLNSRSVTRARLRHGDNVTVGRTSFVFQQRKSQ